MLKKILHTVLLLLFFANVSFAQRGRDAHCFDRIHAIKVAYITDKLHLSGDESARFWPVYNHFDEEKRALRKNFFKKYQGGDKIAGEDEAMHYVDEDLDYQQQELTLRRNYKEKLLKVLSPQQLAELYKAEREFKELLLQQLNNNRRARVAK